MMNPRTQNNRQRQGRSRRCLSRYRNGAALVEFAVFLPVLFTCAFGSLEICSGIFLKHSLTIASYEGVRAATFFGAKKDEAIPIAQKVLDDRKIKNTKIELIPSDAETAPKGTLVTVRVSAPADSSNCFTFMFLNNYTMVAESTMVKE